MGDENKDERSDWENQATERVSGESAPWDREDELVATRQCVRPQRVEERLGGHRYLEKYELARDGATRTLCVRDRLLRRDVAMKVLVDGQDEGAQQRFMAEAQAACQLEHPNIIPIYDLGTDDDGRLYYTRLLIDDHSLAEVVEALKQGRRDAEELYGLRRLVDIAIQVGRAMHYAHVQGVVHRELGPSKILLGQFGQVLVTGWGMAAVRGRKIDVDAPQAKEGVPEGKGSRASRFMPPEQVRGGMEKCDEKSDVYSLGAILFEALALKGAVEEGSAPLAEAIMSGKQRRLRQCCAHGRWNIDADLEQICERALAPKRADRYGGMGPLVEDLEGYLRGHRRRQAAQALERGQRSVERYLDQGARIARVEAVIDERGKKLQPWDGLEAKRDLWRLEDEREALKVERAHSFGQAMHEFQRSLAKAPKGSLAAGELAELYWHRYCEAEEEGDQFDAMYYSLRLRQMEMEPYQRRLSEEVSLDLDSEPTVSSVTLFRLDELDRRRVVSDERRLGETPIWGETLKVGSYLAVMEGPEGGVVRVPVYARRGESVHQVVRLPAVEEMEEGFMYVAGGPFWAGGDQRYSSCGRSRKEVGSFFCAEFPVTFREYMAFLDELEPGEAHRRKPQGEQGHKVWARYCDRRQRWEPQVPGDEESRRGGSLSPQAPQWSMPVVGIRASDAEAYCQWRGNQDGRAYRLLSQWEWEKAGRGVDGRRYPWGDHFDATFCKTKQSRPGRAKMEPVGTFVDDVSVYGVRDLAGGVQEWCVLGEAGRYGVRGGAWNKGPGPCRLANHSVRQGDRRSKSIGFRLAYGGETGGALDQTQLVTERVD